MHMFHVLYCTRNREESNRSARCVRTHHLTRTQTRLVQVAAGAGRAEPEAERYRVPSVYCTYALLDNRSVVASGASYVSR